MATKDRKSLATLPTGSPEFAKAVLERFDTFAQDLKGSFRWSRIRRSVAAYYSEADGDDTEITAGGSDGELTLIRPNQFRNLLQHQLNLITQSPPGYEAAAGSADSEALSQVGLAQGILDHYLRRNRLDALRVRRAELALVAGESWLHAPWDPSKGRVYASDGAKQVHEGDLNFALVPPWDVAYDWLSPDLQRVRECTLRLPRHRYDLAAECPEHAEEILKAEPYRQGLEGFGSDSFQSGGCPDDYVSVYYYYCERTPDRPMGREAQILDGGKVVLSDRNLTEARIPAFRLAPCERIEGPGGHTNNFDLLALNSAYQAQLSVILSNHTTLASQLIAIEKGSGVKPHHLGQGLTAIEYERGTAPPTALNLLATPGEVFTFADLLRKEMETLSAISATNRGSASSASSSGSKEALLAATAQQFATSFHQALLRSDEDLGQHIIDSLRLHATTQRVIAITGKGQAFVAREFSGSDLNAIHLITVRASTPLRDTAAGRYELADRLLKLEGGIVSAEQYLTVVNTGRVEPLYEGMQAELSLIRREGEELRNLALEAPIVAPTDLHALHVQEHRALYSDPSVRRNAELVERIWEHIKEHEAALTPGSPSFAGNGVLLMTGQKPLPEAQPAPSPPGQAGPPQGPPPQGLAGPQGPGPQSPKGKQPQGPQAPGMPPMPQLPVNPATGQRALGPVPEGPALIGR